MPRKAIQQAKRPLNLKLPVDVVARLEELQTLSNADSLSEVVRRALSVFDSLLTIVNSEEGKLFAEFPDGSRERLRMLG